MLALLKMEFTQRRHHFAVFLRALIHILAALLTSWVFWPGATHPDSAASFDHARRGAYTDPQPPFFAFLWRLLLVFGDGPQPYLVFNNLVFWTGLFLVSEYGLRRAGAAWWWSLACGFLPTVYSYLGAVFKDVTLMCAFTLSVGMIFLADAKRSRAAALLAVLPIIVTAFVRYNSLTSVIPLCFAHILVGARVLGNKKLSAFAVTVFAGAYVAALFQFTALVNSTLTRGKSYYSSNLTFMYELVGISLRAQDNVLPTEWSTLPLTDLSKFYSPKGNAKTFFSHLWPPLTVNPYNKPVSKPEKGPKPKFFPAFPEDEAAFKRVRAFWWHAVKKYPAEYFHHKLELAEALLGVATPYACYPYQDTYFWNFAVRTGAALPAEDSAQYKVNRLVTYIFWSFHKSLFYRGWFFTLLALAGLLIVLIWRPRDGETTFTIALALPAAALLNVIVLVLGAPSCDFRYLLPTVLGAVLFFPFALRAAEARISGSSARK